MDKSLIKIFWLTGALFLFSFSCSRYKAGSLTYTTTETTAINEVKSFGELQANKGKNVYVFGTIIKEEFINKGGRPTGNFETLLRLSDGETVHLRNKGENKYNYDDFLNKEVKIEAFIFYGNIDSDNPEHQSRVGYRIDYIKIELVK